MRLIDALNQRGWVPVNEKMDLWFHITDPSDVVTAFEAAGREDIVVTHFFNPFTLMCSFCGITQYRVMVQGESPVCSGTPDVKAFEDRANYDKLSARIKSALGGEDGWIWKSSD